MRTIQITWDDVLKRDDIVGGDIQIKKDGRHYRAPISEFKVEHGLVIINSLWAAERVNGLIGGFWEVTDVQVVPSYFKSWSTFLQPEDIGGGQVQFRTPFCTLVIFPKGSPNQLNPSLVRGLELDLPEAMTA